MRKSNIHNDYACPPTCAMGKSSRGEEMAERAASTARVLPRPRPIPIKAVRMRGREEEGDKREG